MKYYFLLILFVLPLIAVAAEVNTFIANIPFLETSKTTGSYAQALYYMAISIAAVLAVGKLMWVGTKYMLSESVTGKVDAKSGIYNTLLGLLVILAAVLILTTINPNLVNMNVLGNVGEVNVVAPRPNVERFEPGETVFGSEIGDYCEGWISNDQNCIAKYEAALSKSCVGNGGRVNKEEDFNVDVNIWEFYKTFLGPNFSWHKYTCVKK